MEFIHIGLPGAKTAKDSLLAKTSLNKETMPSIKG
jgi:hypothetical protein